jgi:hypothetical protein
MSPDENIFEKNNISQYLSSKSESILLSRRQPKVLIFFLIEIVIIAISLLIGIQIGRNQIFNLPTTIAQTSPTPAQVTEPPTPTISMSVSVSSQNPKWKTYAGQLYKFTYPDEWKILNGIDTKPNDVAIESNDSTLGFSINVNLTKYGTECLIPSTQTTNTIFNGQKKTVNISKGFNDAICNNEEYRQISFGEKHGTDQYYFFFSYNISSEKLALEMLNQILFSFKFTN